MQCYLPVYIRVRLNVSIARATTISDMIAGHLKGDLLAWIALLLLQITVLAEFMVWWICIGPSDLETDFISQLILC